MRTLPDTLATIALTSGTVTVDGHGYLTDPDQWSPDFAIHVAKSEGIKLTDQHIAVINFIRRSLAEHGIIPDARFAFKLLTEPNGITKSQGKSAFFELFPYGHVKQAIKIAGMKQPRAWSTG